MQLAEEESPKTHKKMLGMWLWGARCVWEIQQLCTARLIDMKCFCTFFGRSSPRFFTLPRLWNRFLVVETCEEGKLFLCWHLSIIRRNRTFCLLVSAFFSIFCLRFSLSVWLVFVSLARHQTLLFYSSSSTRKKIVSLCLQGVNFRRCCFAYSSVDGSIHCLALPPRPWLPPRAAHAIVFAVRMIN